MKQIGLGELSTLDMTRALDMIVQEVVTTNAGFSHRYNRLVHNSVAVPTLEEAQLIEAFIEKELADFVVMEPALFGQHGPSVTLNALDGRTRPNSGGNGPGAPSPLNGALNP